MGLALTKKELADIADYSYRRLHEIDKNLPDEEKLFVETEGGYDLALFVQRWVQYNVGVHSESSKSLDSVKADHERIKMQKTEIEVERLRGEYVSVQEAQRVWANIAGTVANRFVNLARKLAPSLVMIGDPDIIEALIDRDVRDALTMIADAPVLTGAKETQDEEAEDEDA